MLEQLIGQIVVLLMLLSVLGWLTMSLLLGKKVSPFWIFPWIITKGFRSIGWLFREISKGFYSLRKDLLRAYPNSLAAIIIAALLGITGALTAIPAALFGELKKIR